MSRSSEGFCRQFMSKLGLPVIVLLVACFATPSLGAKHGVFIGVGDYQHDDPSRSFYDLAGPANDIDSLTRLATQSWQIPTENMTVLVDRQATKAAIISALEGLVKKAQPGDSAVIYFSGHGTSGKDVDPTTGDSIYNLPDGSGALVPYDFSPFKADGSPRSADELSEQLVVGRYHIRPLLTQLDDNNVHVWVIVDACYSGNAVRSAYARNNTGTRFLDLKKAMGKGQSKNIAVRGARRKAAGGYPYSNVVFYAAAGENELARDLRADESFDGRAHGALTDSLLRVATQRAANEFTYETYFESIELSMEEYCNCQHTPNLLPRSTSRQGKVLQQALLKNGQYEAQPPAPIVPDIPSYRVAVNADASQYAAALQLAGVSSGGNWVEELRVDGGDLIAVARNGDLIARWRDLPSQNSVADWLKQRLWLYNRIAQDKLLDGQISVSLREGMSGNGLPIGAEAFFSTTLDDSGHLLILVVFGSGEIIALYPANEREMQSLAAGRELTIPDKDPWISVEAPEGVDTLLFYRLTGSAKDTELLSRFNRYVESGQSIDYRSGLITALENRLNEGNVGAGRLKLVVYSCAEGVNCEIVK